MQLVKILVTSPRWRVPNGETAEAEVMNKITAIVLINSHRFPARVDRGVSVEEEGKQQPSYSIDMEEK